MDDQSTYLYGFTRPAYSEELPVSGVDGRAAVTTLAVGNVAALVSRVPRAELEPLTATEPPPAEWIIPRACSHQAVLTAALAYPPVLPVRLGAVFSADAAIRQFLTDRYETLDAALRELVGREEWSVKVYLRTAQVEEWLRTDDPNLAAQYARLPAAPGARYFAEKRLRAEITRQAQRWAAETADTIQTALRVHALDERPLKLQAGPNAGEPMLWHRAFLVALDQLPGFLAAVEALAAQHSESGLRLQAQGPWPPFNFCPTLFQGSA